MHSDASKEKDPLPRASDATPDGRGLFALMTVGSAVLLMLLGSQTEPGFDGGDWWNEPRNGPLVSLVILFVCSLLAAVFSAPFPRKDLLRETGISLGLSVAFLCAVWLIPQIGYGLSVLIFATVCGVIAGYRGRNLLLISLGMTALMLIIFRYVLGLWFPRAALYELAPWLEVIGAYL